ncbi:MAG: FtsQ-type POTRA domain-containing protein [Sumerlaeia bacterium]
MAMIPGVLRNRLFPLREAVRPASGGRAMPGRSHRDPVPRDLGPRLLHYLRKIPAGLPLLMALACIAVVVAVFVQFVQSSGYFLAQDYEVIGADRVASADVIELITRGEPLHLFQMNVPAAQARLASHPAIHHAEIRRAWPNRLDVMIEERQPQALLLSDGENLLVDGEGVILGRATPDDLLRSNLPLLTGPLGKRYEPGGELEPPFRRAAFSYIGALDSGLFPALLAELHWEPGTGVTLYTEAGTQLLCGHLEPGEALAKAEALSRARNGLDGVGAADLRIADHLPWSPQAVLVTSR